MTSGAPPGTGTAETSRTFKSRENVGAVRKGALSGTGAGEPRDGQGKPAEF